MTQAIGVDVGKHWLDVATGADTRTQRFANTATGWVQLVDWARPVAATQVVVEATGGYEQGVLLALSQAGLPVCQVNPRQARDFAKATGTLAKTDTLDARRLAQMGAALDLHRYTAPSPRQRRLRALVMRRSALVKMRIGERNRRPQADAAVRFSIDEIVDALTQAIQAVEARIEQLLTGELRLARQADHLRHIAGIGQTSAASLLALIPELGRLDRKAIAKLVGVAPLNRDSGALRGQRRTWGGRAPARAALYMATFVAVQHEPSLKAKYQRLKHAGKPPKVALVACMRTLLTRINAMLRDDTPWQSQPTAKAAL